MSPNIPAKPSDGKDPMKDGDLYSSRRHDDATNPDIDANAPQLHAANTLRMSRGALITLAITTVLVAVLAALGVHSMQSRKAALLKPNDEAVNVPDAPVEPPSMHTPAAPHMSSIPVLARPQRNIDSSTLLPPPPSLPVPTRPSLLERRMASADANQPSQSDRGDNASSASAQTENAEAGSAQPLNRPDTLMLRGTYIRCVLETRIITDIPGFTSCVVTEPVYSFNGRKLLLPKGSKVFGKYDMVPNGPRVAVVWDRIVTPTGIDVNMASPGVDDLGGAGHPGYYNAHWASRIGAALLISMLSDAFKYEAAEHGPSQTTISNGVVTQTPFESNTAQTVQNLANQAVQRAANKPPTVTINQGTLINIYVAKDVDFSGVIAHF